MAKLSHAELVPKRRHQAGFVVSATELPRCGAATATCTPRRNPTSYICCHRHSPRHSPQHYVDGVGEVGANELRDHARGTTSLRKSRGRDVVRLGRGHPLRDKSGLGAHSAPGLGGRGHRATVGRAGGDRSQCDALGGAGQRRLDLITPSLVGSHRDDVIKPLQPEVLVPLHPAVEPRPSADAGCCPVRPYGAHGRPASRMEAAAWTSTPRHAW
jgi:hypothetical protein